MKFAKRLLLASLVLGGSTTAWAQDVDVDQVSANIGDTGVTVNVNYTPTAGIDAAGFDLTVMFDDTNLTPTVPANCGGSISGGTFDQCAVAGNTITIRVVDTLAKPAGTLAVLTFDVAGSAPAAMYPLTLGVGAGTGFSDPLGSDIPAGTLTNGEINVLAGPQGALGLSAAPTAIQVTAGDGVGAGSSTVTLTNTGNAALDVSDCTIAVAAPGANGTTLTTPAFTAVSIPTGGTSTVPVACDAGTAPEGPVDGILTCTHNGSNGPTTPITVSCSTLAAVAVPNSPMSAVIANVNPGSTGSVTIGFTETGGDLGYDITGCTLASGVDFTVTSTFPITVAAGGSGSVSVEGTAPADGSTPPADTLTCTLVDANAGALPDAVIAISLTSRPEVIPTLSQWALILMALVLAGFAGLTLRRREGFQA